MKFWYIYGRKFTKYLHGTQSLLNILMIFGIKKNRSNFYPYNVFLAVATNIPVILMTGFVVQGHKWLFNQFLMTMTFIVSCHDSGSHPSSVCCMNEMLIYEGIIKSINPSHLLHIFGLLPSCREFLIVVGSEKARATNMNCEVITEVKHDRSEPTIDITFCEWLNCNSNIAKERTA